ncbi:MULTISPECIES: hypothetical protein [Bartonella]|uniref:hypothetical protein n=1 Tax=Bartonella TaxID=773 RepID=UPI0004BA52B9|nr:hypothetical protein [Bartonella grahamii]
MYVRIGVRSFFSSLDALTIREWPADTEPPLRSFSVCSDTQINNRRKNQDAAAMDA